MLIEREIRDQVAFAALARESALNTLNLEMVTELLALLKAWERDPNVSIIVLRGAGAKSFCSGGDVKTVCLELLRGNENYARDFFATEYRLDYAIHTCSKPVVVVGHGYVLGGGLGLLSGAACRVVTSSTVVAMPEISIGLFCDVGAGWFLNRLPGKLGLFLALTAARLRAADALAVGLADSFVPDAKLAALYDALAGNDWRGVFREGKGIEASRVLVREFVASVAAPFVHHAGAPETLGFFSEINAALDSDDPREAFAGLERLGLRSDSVWLKRAAEAFAKGSPTSAFVVFEALRRGRGLKLADVFRMDLDLAMQCCRRHDFKEGVRALLIDKDQKPQWLPARLSEVTDESVLAHFASPWPGRNGSPLRDL